MSDKKRLFKAVATGAFCGIIAGVLLICLFTGVILKIGLPNGAFIDSALAVILGMGAFVGGFIAAKRNKGAGLVVGALTGVAIFLLLVVAAAVRNTADLTCWFPIKLASAVTGSSLGGILAMRERKHTNF